MDKFGFGYDCYRKFKKYKASIRDLLLYRDLRVIKVYRKANYYFSKNKKIRALFFSLKLKKMCNKYNFNVPVSTKVGYGLYIGHNGSLVINSQAIVGNNCNISTGVVIGAENRGIRKGSPIIGNRVWIGANSVIVGKITIGDNVLIAPNSFVNFNVPSNSIVIGNPGKIIMNEHATDDYITNEVRI